MDYKTMINGREVGRGEGNRIPIYDTCLCMLSCVNLKYSNKGHRNVSCLFGLSYGPKL